MDEYLPPWYVRRDSNKTAKIRLRRVYKECNKPTRSSAAEQKYKECRALLKLIRRGIRSNENPRSWIVVVVNMPMKRIGP